MVFQDANFVHEYDDNNLLTGARMKEPATQISIIYPLVPQRDTDGHLTSDDSEILLHSLLIPHLLRTHLMHCCPPRMPDMRRNTHIVGMMVYRSGRGGQCCGERANGGRLGDALSVQWS